MFTCAYVCICKYNIYYKDDDTKIGAYGGQKEKKGENSREWILEAYFSIIFTVFFHNEYSIFISQELQRKIKANLRVRTDSGNVKQ